MGVLKNISSGTVGHLAVIFSIVVWAVTFISTKILLDSFNPLEILIIRFIVGYIVLWMIYPHKMGWLSLKQELFLFAAGATGITLYFVFENVALTYTYASNVGIILATVPFFTALIGGIVFPAERVGKAFFIGFVVAILGVGLISLNGAELELNPVGDLLVLVAAVIWAVYSILLKEISSWGIPSLAMTRRTFAYAIISMIFLIPFWGFSWKSETVFEIVNLGNLLFLGVLASAICFFTWNFGVKAIGAVKSSVYLYASPMITVIFSAIILDEKITPMELGGIGLILLGLIISQRMSR